MPRGADDVSEAVAFRSRFYEDRGTLGLSTCTSARDDLQPRGPGGRLPVGLRRGPLRRLREPLGLQEAPEDDGRVGRRACGAPCCVMRQRSSLPALPDAWPFPGTPPRFVSAFEEFDAFALPWVAGETNKAVMVRDRRAGIVFAKHQKSDSHRGRYGRLWTRGCLLVEISRCAWDSRVFDFRDVERALVPAQVRDPYDRWLSDVQFECRAGPASSRTAFFKRKKASRSRPRGRAGADRERVAWRRADDAEPHRRGRRPPERLGRLGRHGRAPRGAAPRGGEAASAPSPSSASSRPSSGACASRADRGARRRRRLPVVLREEGTKKGPRGPAQDQRGRGPRQARRASCAASPLCRAGRLCATAAVGASGRRRTTTGASTRLFTARTTGLRNGPGALRGAVGPRRQGRLGAADPSSCGCDFVRRDGDPPERRRRNATAPQPAPTPARTAPRPGRRPSPPRWRRSPAAAPAPAPAPPPPRRPPPPSKDAPRRALSPASIAFGAALGAAVALGARRRR